MMQQMVRHEGRIVAMHNDRAEVLISRLSACAACKVAATCNSAECKPMRVMARFDKDRQVALGQHVTVAMAARNAWLSVALGYGLPLMAFMLACAVTYSAHCTDGVIALVGMLAVLAYYAVLYLFRHRLDGMFQCRIIDVKPLPKQKLVNKANRSLTRQLVNLSTNRGND